MRADQSCLCHLCVKKLALTCSSRCAKNCTQKKEKKNAEFLLRPPCALLSTRSRVWQLHVDILPAAYSELQQGWGRKKVEGDRVAVAERRQPALGAPSSAQKNWRPRRTIRASENTHFVHFSGITQATLCSLVLDRSWSPLVAYLHKVQYDLQNLFFAPIVVDLCARVCRSNDCDTDTVSSWCYFVHLWGCCHWCGKCPQLPWDWHAGLLLLSSNSPGPGQCTGLIEAQQVHYLTHCNFDGVHFRELKKRKIIHLPIPLTPRKTGNFST